VFEFAEWLGSTPLSVAIQSRLWLTPLLQTIHIVIGVGSALYFGRTVVAAAASANTVYSGRARVVAVATILLWVAIMFLGRWIAYDVEIWESWHLA
jgi:hypothetical protein